jgi:hypothetical protein
MTVLQKLARQGMCERAGCDGYHLGNRDSFVGRDGEGAGYASYSESEDDGSRAGKSGRLSERHFLALPEWKRDPAGSPQGRARFHNSDPVTG